MPLFLRFCSQYPLINYLEDENENDEDNNAIKFESLESFSDDNENYNENYNENVEEQEIFNSQKTEQAQCPRADLNKKFLPRPKTTTA